MNDLRVFVEESITQTNSVMIGFYILNGVFNENDNTRGISYCLDHCLHEMLSQEIADCGIGHVRTFTNYGYSSFVVKCTAENVPHILEKMAQILFCDHLPSPLCMDSVFSYPIKRQKRCQDLELLYCAHRSPGSPLSYSLRPRSGVTYGPERLNQWKAMHYTSDQCNIILTGAVPDEIMKCTDSTDVLALPPLAVTKNSVPKCIPWKQTQLVLSGDYEFGAENILCSEAACKWLEPNIAWGLNNAGCRLGRIQIWPDYIQEWRVNMQCPRGKENVGIQLVLEALENEPETDEALHSVRRQTMQDYLNLASDPIEWNLFAGYNSVTGFRYNLAELLREETYCKEITKATVSSVIHAWRRNQDISVFATAAI